MCSSLVSFPSYMRWSSLLIWVNNVWVDNENEDNCPKKKNRIWFQVYTQYQSPPQPPKGTDSRHLPNRYRQGEAISGSFPNGVLTWLLWLCRRCNLEIRIITANTQPVVVAKDWWMSAQLAITSIGEGERLLSCQLIFAFNSLASNQL